MKNVLSILCLLLLCWTGSFAQQINYENSLEKAEKLARKENKILALLIASESPTNSAEILPALKDPNITAKFNEHFVNFKIDRSDSASVRLVKKYYVKNFPVFIFINGKGRLLLKKTGNIPSHLISDMLDRAMDDERYLSGDKSTTFLKHYINKRISRGITNNAKQIEEYVNGLSPENLNTYSEVLFILQAGPRIDGRANALLNTNKNLIDSVYKTELKNVTADINTRMIANTMASAIAHKKINRARVAADFTRWSLREKSPLIGQEEWDGKLLQYYYGVKDTKSVLRHTVNYYDTYYMNVGVDSIRKRDEKNRAITRSYGKELAASGKRSGADIRSRGYTYGSLEYSMMLNIGARSILATETKNHMFLSKAMSWSGRSVDLNPNSSNHDTLAHLQYRLGLYAVAEATLQKAIQMHTAANRDTTKMEEDLKKIKKRTL
ncbi:hypothetical protein [Daejeonella sp.]|uniref:hypothetical protein n=1 Tax=Daejeonella sp. TaxID=2805397 RepID=UPI0030BBFC06